MKQRIQISAKNLVAMALATFCPRCFCIRMKCGDNLPFQIFPGIFSSIDSYSKKVTAAHCRQHGRVPKWFDGFGDSGEPIVVPGWQKFQLFDEETNILLTGVPDEILRHPKHGLWIGDYKTARCTENQDDLAPMYEVQLNCCALIASRIGLGPVYSLGLLYYEPVTDLEPGDHSSLIRKDGFFLRFSPKSKSVKLEPIMVSPLVRKVRDICDLAECPVGKPGCRDCSRFDRLTSAAGVINS